VTEAGRLLDRLDAIAVTVEVDGLTVAGSAGQPRPHPLLAEQRQAQLALGRLLDLLGLIDPDRRARIPRQRSGPARRRGALGRGPDR
jgi:hypothetical protein